MGQGGDGLGEDEPAGAANGDLPPSTTCPLPRAAQVRLWFQNTDWQSPRPLWVVSTRPGLLRDHGVSGHHTHTTLCEPPPIVLRPCLTSAPPRRDIPAALVTS